MFLYSYYSIIVSLNQFNTKNVQSKSSKKLSEIEK